ncbi:MAG: glycosyltransferase family 4 protein [Candidatus Diapherotrites archaeon]|nr:glycosyltransferase family 4 protein [Candidatus Diapherotrites archaeon]
MNILHVSANYPPRIGGPASSVPVIAKLLAEKGHSVHVAALAFPGFPNHEHVNGFDVNRAWYAGKDPSRYGLLDGLSAIEGLSWLVFKLVRDKNIDIIHAHDLNISVSAAVKGRLFSLRSIPLLAKYTGDLSVEYLLNNGKMSFEEMQKKYEASAPNTLPLRVRFMDFLQYSLASHAQYLIAPSAFQKSRLEAQGISPEKTFVVHNAVDSNLFAPSKTAPPSNGVFKILYFGRIVPWKGLQDLAEALKILVEKEGPLFELTILGTGSYQKELTHTVQQKGLGHCIHFQNAVPHERLPSIIARHDMVVLPSWYDPFPHGVLEAMACAKPLVATRVGGIPEAVEDHKTGLLVEPHQPQALAHAFEELMHNPALGVRLGKNARKMVEHRFSYDARLADELEKTYMHALSGSM